MISLYRLYALNILSLELCLFLSVSFSFCIPVEQCLVSVLGGGVMGVHVFVRMCMWQPEVDCGHLSQLLSTLIFGSKSLSQDLKLTDMGRLSVQWTPGIHLSLPPQG